MTKEQRVKTSRRISQEILRELFLMLRTFKFDPALNVC